MQDEVKDLPVVVVSLAGAYRGGKSFMLNFFLRYLTSPVSAREDGTWLGGDSEPLEGFSWRGGSKRNTTGILLWSEPILTSLPSGEKVAVLLMDTQGTFDSKSTVRDCSTIFALSTLVSSVQIYNLPGGNIQEDDLQHLQLFTEYGKLINEQDGAKAFQVLEFLVRDWANDFEYAYGNAGGQLYLDEMLKIVPNQAKELSDLRRHIRASFETVSCFLMPHPGLKVRRPDFKGSLKELEPDFVDNLKDLASSIFGAKKLKVKTINGQPMKARDLFTYFNTYMDIFNSNKIPTPTSIMKVSIQHSTTERAPGVYWKLTTSWREKGVIIGKKRLTNLRFADDIVLFSATASDLKQC
ncbi:Atlastin [Operophtera brumata]|uniref:Atlastin n=1 Tax=Operophtera brumata TaxID=104452 RepID=A0A0L7L6K3_OPEBR|nr:Atlastin [Operophtera brumata]